MRKPILRPPARPVQAPASRPAAPKPVPRPGAPKPVAARPKPGIGHNSGAEDTNDGFAVAHKINRERQAKAEVRANRPLEFRMKPGENGVKGVTVVITDMARLPAMPHFQYYHRWGYKEGVPESSKEDICIKDGPEGCPLCKKLGKEGTYEMVLTCLDGRAYTPKNGPNAGKEVKVSKKLLIVKTGMIPKFERLYREHKTFRGMVITLFRDGKKDAAIGSEVKFVKMLPEAALRKSYGDLSNPTDYHKAYPRPSYNELADRWGEASSNESSVGGDDFSGDADADSVPF